MAPPKKWPPAPKTDPAPAPTPAPAANPEAELRQAAAEIAAIDDLVVEQEPSPAPGMAPLAPPAPTPVDRHLPPRPANPHYVSAAMEELDAAPAIAKLVIADDRTALLNAGGAERVVPRTDPAGRHLPAGSYIRKLAEGQVTGYLPLGAARDVRPHVIEAATAQAVLREMIFLVQGR